MNLRTLLSVGALVSCLVAPAVASAHGMDRDGQVYGAQFQGPARAMHAGFDRDRAPVAPHAGFDRGGFDRDRMPVDPRIGMDRDRMPVDPRIGMDRDHGAMIDRARMDRGPAPQHGFARLVHGIQNWRR